MAIRINCPFCSGVNNVDEAKRGKKARCRQCEKLISVPAAAGADERSPRKKKSQAKGGSSLMLILGGVAAALLICLVGVVGVGGYYLFGKPKADRSDAQAKVEPPQDEERKKNPDPAKKNEPEKKEPDSTKAGPALSPELQRVKDATVMVSALLPDGQRIEGTGFLAGDHGLIITSALAAGSLDPKNPLKTVEVTLYPGQPNAVKKTAVVLGVDVANDVAALRLDGPMLPAPLMFEESSKIAPAQTVHVAGYQAMTATEITTLKKALQGTLEKLHVKNGINASSSGAAVVSSSGFVVGVALATAKDLLAQQAIPSDVVKRFLDGKIGVMEFGKTRVVDKKTVIRVGVMLGDPLQKIKEVRTEVWTGLPTPPRPYSYQQPTPMPGDGDRQPHPLIRFGSGAIGEIPVPAVVPRGQVVWVQPVITLADNSMQWGDAVVMPLPDSPYDKQPANLIANVLMPDKRTVTLKATHTYTFKDASDKKPITFAVETSILEVMAPDPSGAAMSLGLGNYSAVNNRDGTKMATPKTVIDIVRLTKNIYTIDNANKQLKRSYTLPPANILKDLREPAMDELFRISSPLEAMMIPQPNREVQPGDSWPMIAGLTVRSKGEMGELTLVLTGVYEGLTKDKKADAVVTLVGKVQARDAKFKEFEGDVAGKYSFDQKNGIITAGQLKLASPAGADKDSYVLDIDLTRSPGNPQNIKLPPDFKTDPVAKAKIILDSKGSLSNKDLYDVSLSDLKKKKLAHYKDILVKLEQGKKYAIQLDSTAFDAYLKLYAPTGMLISQDDNSGTGTNARIVFVPPATGNFHIFAIAHAGKVGAFHLTVTENP